MSIDPADDCTFWYTTEYNSSNKGGNWATRIASFRFPGCGGPDLPPAVSITSPANGSLLEGTSTINGTAADDGAVSKVEVAIDSGPFQLAAGTTSWSFPLDMTTLRPGYHTVNARATDNKGQIGTAVIAVFPNPLPQGTITFPVPNASIFGTITVAGTAVATNSTVAKVEVSACGQPFSLASGTTSWTFVWDTTLCADGSAVIAARVTDGTGNSSAVSESVVIANKDAPPSVVITSVKKNSTFRADFGVQGTAADIDGSIAKVEISVDNGPWQLCQNTTSWACSVSTANLTKGKHLLTARATDNIGKVGFDSLTFMTK
jgi:Bacterial Ig domain